MSPSILGNHIVGPIFLGRKLKRTPKLLYPDLMQNRIESSIAWRFQENPNGFQLTFQQGDAPPH